MRTRPTFAALFVGVAACLGVAGCSYAPHLKDGELRCSLSGQCPEGYACQNDACFAASTDGGLGSDAPTQTLLNRYIGSWTLDPTAAVSNHCDNGTAEIRMLSPASNPSPMTITAGIAGRSDLISQWLCNLELRVDAAGAHLSDPPPTCRHDSSTDPAQPSETWTATQFDIVLSGLRSATHTATYTRVDQYADGTVVNCSQAVTAPLTKN